MLKARKIIVGGIDYSPKLVEIARQVCESNIEVGEAINIGTDKKFDMVLSDSVFAYFPSVEYGEIVLEKMFKKTNKIVAILEIFDKDLQDECNIYRRKLVADYEKRYEGLEKVFYPREMFINFVKEKGCRIEFTKVENEYYWNSKYQYNCFIYKK